MSCFSSYCVFGTGYPYDDTYTSGGTHNGQTYWSGISAGYVIYYNSGSTQWCLSLTLDGTCLLSGKSPCGDISCPDLCSDIFGGNICPTPTPTPTSNCTSFDFSAIFDCDFIPTPTTTPTPTATPTLTPTPTSSSICSIINVDATITGLTPTVTPTMTQTPSNSPIINRLCNFSGDVTFDMVNIKINCPVSKEFKDCNNSGIRYYTGDALSNPSGGTINVDMVFRATVDGISTCISYVGTNQDYGNINTITLYDYFGYFPTGCTECLGLTTPTPTPTPTKTPTPTISTPCYCYALITTKSATITYVDCYGNTQTTGITGSVGAPQLSYVCSRVQPTSNVGSQASATISNICGGFTPSSCTVPTQCYCYELRNRENTSKTFLYLDCQTGLFNLKTVSPNSIDYVCSKIYPVLGSNFNGVINKGGTCTSESNCLVPSLTPTRTPTPTPTPTKNVIIVSNQINLKGCEGGTCNGGLLICNGEPALTLYSFTQTTVIQTSTTQYFSDIQCTVPYTGVVKSGNIMFSISGGVSQLLGVEGIGTC